MCNLLLILHMTQYHICVPYIFWLCLLLYFGCCFFFLMTNNEISYNTSCQDLISTKLGFCWNHMLAPIDWKIGVSIVCTERLVICSHSIWHLNRFSVGMTTWNHNQ